MGLSRGLLLMLGFCMVEVHSQRSQKDADDDTSTAKVYHCQYVEALYNLMISAANDHKYNCGQSQLTDASRFILDNTFYSYRKDVSQGRIGTPEYNNVFKMNYHWICEYLSAFIISKNLPATSPIVTKETLNEMLTDLNERNLALNFEPHNGTFEDIDAYNFTIDEIPIEANSQTELLKQFSDDPNKYLNLWDVFLKSDQGRGPKRVWPGTSYFGCAIQIKDGKEPDQKTLNHLICVFATRGDAERVFMVGQMDNATCANSMPPGVSVPDPADSNRTLCFDQKILNSSDAENNMPCQFFYDSKEVNFSSVEPCIGFPPDMNKGGGLWDPPSNDFSKLVIHLKGKRISISLPINGVYHTTTTTTETPDGALKLHSIQIYLIVFIALMSSTFSQLFSNYT